MRKAEQQSIVINAQELAGIQSLEKSELEVLQVLSVFENKVREAAREYSPAVLANYAYELAKEYNQFYQNVPIFAETDPIKLRVRIAMTKAVADAIKKAMGLLGIEVPERM